ncbi:DUF5777 family beta-barrel protein [Acidobacteria bacterium AH-259-O06]|nr:DUF5777 family beta-barrel protein [Acidobacteria bacterium AH-259-O06]
MNLYRFFLLSSLLLWPLTAYLLGFSGGPLPRLTGGFQEQTCHSCHNSFRLNEGRTRGGMFYIAGVPATYNAGQSYPISVLIGQPGQSRWGFELSVRAATSAKQAGELVPVDEMTQVKEEHGVLYIEHTSAGTRRGTPNGPVEFHFNWIAPDPSEGPVVFNAAGNAANSSEDPSGDYIYTAGAYSGVAGLAFPRTGIQLTKERRKLRRTESSTLINLPSPLDRQQGDVEVHIQHRFLDTVSSGAGEAFGIDQGANINLGMNYSATDRLTLGISRTRFDNVITLGGGFEIQSKADSFWKMDVVGGVEGQSNFQRRYSPFIQLATALDYKNLRFYLVPTMIFNTRNDELLQSLESFAINPEDNHTFSLGIGADLALNPTFSIVGEFVPRLTGFGGFFDDDPTVGGGLTIRTWGHVFTIVLSTSREFTPSRYGLNGSLSLPNFSDNVVLGFNIYRRMR